MKRRILPVLLIALLALTAACASRGEKMEFNRPAPDANARKFTVEDLTMDGLTLGISTLDEVTARWGEPQSRSEVADGAGLVLEYGFGQAYLNNLAGEYRINGVTILGSGASGPRGIKFGDSHEALIAMFPDELSLDLVNGFTYLYASGETENADGSITYEDPSCCFSVDEYGTGALSATGSLVENGLERAIYFTVYYTNGAVDKISVNYGTTPVEQDEPG